MNTRAVRIFSALFTILIAVAVAMAVITVRQTLREQRAIHQRAAISHIATRTSCPGSFLTNLEPLRGNRLRDRIHDRVNFLIGERAVEGLEDEMEGV